MPSETLVFVTGKLQKYMTLSMTVLGRKRLRCRIFQELKEVSISKWEKDTEFSMVRKHGNRDQKPGEILTAYSSPGRSTCEGRTLDPGRYSGDYDRPVIEKLKSHLA